jgi:hypothetical protein
MPRLLIGFTGAKQSGKTTAAKHLMKSGFVGLSFAHGIRMMLTGLLMTLGYGRNRINELMNEDKEQSIPPFYKSCRQMMQLLGTEWGRDLIHPDLWVIAARAQIERYGDADIVFDDVRFENEAAMIRELGGLIIHVDRLGADDDDRHRSEDGICDHIADRFIDNDEDLESFLVDVLIVVGGGKNDSQTKII